MVLMIMLMKVNSYLYVNIMNENNGIKVRIFDLKKGLIEYEHIKIIRIISKDYNLLVMQDYLPILGEIEGSVDIKNEDIEINYKDIKAFYMNSNNVFNLMIKEGN